MKTLALIFAVACSSVALLDNSAEAATPRLVKPGTAIGINPQPLPPRVLSSRFRLNPGTLKGLNPQPLPPRF